MAGPGIDEAGGRLVLENMIQTRLIAGNTGIDLVGTATRCLDDKLRISQKRSRHRNQIRVPAFENRFSDARSIDPVTRD